jgi:hypothetical protein
MVEWLRTAEATNDKAIALSHAWEISQVEEELSLAAWNEIDRIGARLMISGHTHTCEILTPERSERANTIFTAHPDIIGFIDGGKVGENYIASKLTLTQEGFTVESVNNLGEEILKESFTW